MNLNRIFIFGGTGSGKTTLARKISKKLEVPHYTTDHFIYKKNWTDKYTEKERDKKLKSVAVKKKWIMEGVHRGEWIYPAFKKATFVIILAIPRYKLFKRVILREIRSFLKKEKTKSKMKDFFLLLKYAYIYKNDNFIHHQRLVKEYKKEFVILRNNKQINYLLEEIR